MRAVSSIKTIKRWVEHARKTGSVGFVPTMGAFHEGHLSLMRKAKRENGFVIVSIFVNPLQFGPKEDYAIYPRELPTDRKKAAAEGVDLFWVPSEKVLFPPDFQTTIEVGEISHRWEGASRPGHFKGVTTIVAKLLQIVQPDRLYLGQKDYQQTRVICQMINDLHFDVKVRVCPTMREKDGLAMSSRNRRLSGADRKTAATLYRALQKANAIVRRGERDAEVIRRTAESVLRPEKRMKIEYLALCDPVSLVPIDPVTEAVILIAAIKIGGLRLIDNILLRT